MKISRRDAVKLIAGTVPVYYASRAVVLAANNEPANNRRGNLRRGNLRRGNLRNNANTLPTKEEPLFNILLGRPTDKSVTANIITKEDLEFYVEYGTSSGKYTQKTKTFNTKGFEGKGYDANNPKEPVEFVLDGLKPDAKNYYQIVYKKKDATEWSKEPEYAVQTQRKSGSKFCFTIISDSHLGQYGGNKPEEYELYELALKNVSADKPDFHLDLGDTFGMDPLPPFGSGLGTGMTEPNADAAYYLERPFLSDICAEIPFYYVLGNHENEEGWNWDDKYESGNKSVAVVGLKARKKYFPNPIPDDFYSGNEDKLPPEYVAEFPEASKEDPYREDYYAWEWGDALFVAIDPYQYSMVFPNDDGSGYAGEGTDGEKNGDRWDWSLGIKQYLWLKKTLEESKAKYKFVFAHHVTGGSTQYGRGGLSAVPFFEWGGKSADGTWDWDKKRPKSEGWTVPVHQLFIDNGVSAFIHGHDHMYAYEIADGIVYLEVPKPDDTSYDYRTHAYGVNEKLYNDAIKVIPASGHIRVTVSPEKATFDYVRAYLPGAVDPYNSEAKNGKVEYSFDIKPK